MASSRPCHVPARRGGRVRIPAQAAFDQILFPDRSRLKTHQQRSMNSLVRARSPRGESTAGAGRESGHAWVRDGDGRESFAACQPGISMLEVCQGMRAVALGFNRGFWKEPARNKGPQASVRRWERGSPATGLREPASNDVPLAITSHALQVVRRHGRA